MKFEISKKIFFVTLFCSGLIFLSPVSTQDIPFHDPEQVVDQLYKVISGEAGERNWDLFHSLFHSTAKMGAVSTNRDSIQQFSSFTPKEYEERNRPFFETSGFYEVETKRYVDVVGNMAFIKSNYEFKFTPNGAPQAIGTNLITLVNQNGWKITHIIWENEMQ